MILTDLRFCVLFVIAWVCFALVPRGWRPIVLAAWGVAFYALYAQLFLVVVLVLTVMVFLAERRAFALASGFAVVTLLIYFKFLQAASEGGALFQSVGIGAVIVPLGLSYLSFELLHVLIERQRGKLPPPRLGDLLAFVFFAPARVAGPIRRYPEFTVAVREARVSSEGVYAGLIRMLTGLAKKFLIADLLRVTVVLELNFITSPVHAWKVAIAYAFQIYLDFSAYTDLAIGFALMMGIALPENFRRPYLAVNIRDFWDRWHITLSHWVRDYVFVPTGRRLFQTRLRRMPSVIAVLSYLVTFLIVGAWHGLTLSFIIWGLYHGTLLSAYHVIRAKMPASIAQHPLYHSHVAYGLSVALTFLLVTIGWVPFMTTWPNAMRMLGWMIGTRA